MIFADLLSNCEKELLLNDNIFNDDNLLSELDESMRMDNSAFDFLNVKQDLDLKDSMLMDTQDQSLVTKLFLIFSKISS